MRLLTVCSSRLIAAPAMARFFASCVSASSASVIIDVALAAVPIPLSARDREAVSSAESVNVTLSPAPKPIWTAIFAPAALATSTEPLNKVCDLMRVISATSAVTSRSAFARSSLV